MGGIPEEIWAESGWEGVCWDNPTVAWGHWGLLVVTRVWKKFSVKLEVRDPAVVSAVVKSDVVVGARKFRAQLAIAVGGRSMQRGSAPTKGGAPNRGPPLVPLCAMPAGR